MSPWQWRELASANLSAVLPVPYPNGYADGRVDAWNGMTVMGSKLCMAGVGGHTDGGGNEGYLLDLKAPSPSWEMRGTPTPTSLQQVDVTHYLDGRPSSSHTYYSLFADKARNKIFRMGLQSAWGSGNFQRPKVDAFSLTTNDWDAANTWPDVPEAVDYARSQAQHPVTGDIYVVGATRLWRFNLAAGTWTGLASMPDNGSGAYYHPMVFDSTRNRFIVLGDAYATPAGILIYDVAANSWSKSTLTGASANAVASAGGQMAHYLKAIDRFVVTAGAAGGVLHQVDAATLIATPLATTGGSAMPASLYGPFQKLQHVPELGGLAYQPRGNSKLWFLATE